MKVLTTERGFEYLEGASVGQSSALGSDFGGAAGASFLWVGSDHLDRGGVMDMVLNQRCPPGTRAYLDAWLSTGSLVIHEPKGVPNSKLQDWRSVLLDAARGLREAPGGWGGQIEDCERAAREINELS